MRNTTTNYNGFNLLEKNTKGWVIEESTDLYGNHYYLYMISGHSQDSYRFYCVNADGVVINKESHLIKENAKFSFDQHLKGANKGFLDRFKWCSVEHLKRLFTDSKCDLEKQAIVNELSSRI